MEFDKPLVAGNYEPSIWTVRVANWIYHPLAARVTAGNPLYVSLTGLGFAEFSAGPDYCKFAPPPYDLYGQNGLRVEAFQL